MEPTSQSRYRSTAPLPRGASGEEKKLYEMPRPPLNRGGGSASALTERLLLIVFSRQGIALAGYRCTVEFVVDGLVVVDKACFHHDLAAGGVLHGVGAGKPITVCILEPVFYQSFQTELSELRWCSLCPTMLCRCSSPAPRCPRRGRIPAIHFAVPVLPAGCCRC